MSINNPCPISRRPEADSDSDGDDDQENEAPKCPGRKRPAGGTKGDKQEAGEPRPAKKRKQQADYDEWKLLVLQKALGAGSGIGTQGGADPYVGGEGQEAARRGPTVARMKQSKLVMTR